MTPEPTPGAPAERFSPYQRRLFVFLGVASFFEGYDLIALTQILPNLRADMALERSVAGYLVSVVNLGTVLAYLMVRRADLWGRRRVLTWTIAGYTVFTFLTGFAPNVWWFGAAQLLARIFLISEWAISMVIAAEEFPAGRRGMVIGVVNATASLGSVFCAGVAPLLLTLPWGWRTVYLVGILPLVLLAYARRGLRETRRFEEQAAGKTDGGRSLFAIWRTPYRRRLLQLSIIWFLTYLCTQNAVAFWKEFAVAERGFTDREVGTTISVAALVSMPMVFLVGKLLDRIGRRPGAVVVFGTGAVGVAMAYLAEGRGALTVGLTLGIFCASAVLPVLNTYTAELFPTELRGDAFAWSNNLLGRVGYVASPTLVALAASRVGWGPAVASTAVFPLLALALILLLLPETRARELEETARL